MKPSTHQKPKSAHRRHATAALLLDTTVALLEKFHMDELNLAMVLERSGVSHGSLYHHFTDFSDLVVQAVVIRFEDGLNKSLSGVRELLDSVDAADFRQRAEDLIVRSIGSERQHFRLLRVEVFAAVQTRPQLAKAVAHAQQKVIDEQGGLYAEFQRRGWMRDDLDPVVLSSVVVSMVLGRVVDDLSERPVPADEWNAVSLVAFQALLFPD